MIFNNWNYNILAENKYIKNTNVVWKVISIYGRRWNLRTYGMELKRGRNGRRRRREG